MEENNDNNDSATVFLAGIGLLTISIAVIGGVLILIDRIIVPLLRDNLVIPPFYQGILFAFSIVLFFMSISLGPRTAGGRL